MNWAEFDRTIEQFDATGDWHAPDWMQAPGVERSIEVAIPAALPVEQRAGPPLRTFAPRDPAAVPSYRTSKYASHAIGAKEF